MAFGFLAVPIMTTGNKRSTNADHVDRHGNRLHRYQSHEGSRLAGIVHGFPAIATSWAIKVNGRAMNILGRATTAATLAATLGLVLTCIR